jgi:hypothetical protein
MSTIKVLGIDPSMGGTGIALLEGEPGTDGKIIEAIRHTPEGDGVGPKASALASFVVDYIREKLPNIIVIETPFEGTRGGAHSKRSAMTLPTYGMAVGAVCAAVTCGRIPKHACGVLCVPADQWCKITTRQDPYKENRVRFAASIYGMQPEDFGCKSKAGDIADAVLLARYGLKVRTIHNGSLDY